VNILVVSHKLPYPVNGAAIVLFNLLKHLSDRHAIHLVCFYQDAEELDFVAELRRYCARVEAVRQPPRWSAGLLTDVALRGHSLHVARYRSPELSLKCGQVLAETNVDAVQVETFYMAQHLPLGLEQPVVLNMHNLTWLLQERAAAVARGPARLATAFEAARVRREELAVCRSAAACVVLSEADRKGLLEAAREVRAEVVVPGVDVDRLRPSEGPSDEPNLVYVGHMGYRPNVDAMQFFCAEILPLVAREIPNVRLTIVGDPSPGVRRLGADPRVRLAGRQVDVRRYVQEAAVSVVPLRFGGGVRIKILEAMAMGSAIVSTTVGAEGLGLSDGAELLLADQPRVFAAQVTRLLKDPELRRGLGSRARRAAVERFSWRRAADRFDEIYRELKAGVSR
jgi:sugar transferase (PEP-CTERM/EpsH1 system associated)